MDLITGKKSEPLYTHPETLDEIVRVIRYANVDIIGLQEADGNAQEIATRLGWECSSRLNILSRFPIWEMDQNPCVCVEVEPNKIILVSNVHALSDPYGPYLFQEGYNLEQVKHIERSFRLPPIEAILKRLIHVQTEMGCPLLLSGDFNSPSMFDWTEQVKKHRSLSCSIDWPLSERLHGLGFRDSYRTVYPCPISHPGWTWLEDEIKDRIDWILYRGNVRTQRSWIMGGDESICEILYQPWPSDHCAVVSEFQINPVYFSSNRVFVSRFVQSEGETLQLRSSSDIEIWKEGHRLKTIRTKSTRNVYQTQLNVGTYELRNQYQWITYIVRPLSPRVQISVVHVHPSSIRVSLTNAPAKQMDWIRIRKVYQDKTLVYQYTNSICNGNVHIQPPFYMEENQPTWPLESGEYECSLLEDGSDRVVATTKFTVE